MECYLNVLKKYDVFIGRSTRTEFWIFTFIDALIVAILSLITLNSVNISGALILIYQLAVLCPKIAVTIRRLHDIDKSGFWTILYFIPMLNMLLLLFLLLKGTNGPNRFGEDPRILI